MHWSRIDRREDVGAEDAMLIDRLGCADTVKLRWTISGGHNQWNTIQMGLNDAGMKFRSRRARRHEHQNRTTSRAGEAQCDETRRALVEANVPTKRAGGDGECQWRRP